MPSLKEAVLEDLGNPWPISLAKVNEVGKKKVDEICLRKLMPECWKGEAD